MVEDSPRSTHNDVGSVFDPIGLRFSFQRLTNKENGYGLIYHRVRGRGTQIQLEASGVWRDANNGAEQRLRFNRAGANAAYEPAHFKNHGGKTVAQQAWYNSFGGDEPAEVDMFISQGGPDNSFVGTSAPACWRWPNHPNYEHAGHQHQAQPRPAQRGVFLPQWL